MNAEKIKVQISTLEEMLLVLRQQLAEAEAVAHRFEWNLLCDRVGILRDAEQRNSWNHICYVGFNTKKDAEAYVSRLKKAAQWCKETGKDTPYTSIEIREAKRLLTARWELKCVDLSITLINKLLAEMAEPEELADAV